MMGWIIDAAVDSGVFDHVYVSTESREIASTASLLGAEVPYIRGHPVNGEVGTWLAPSGSQICSPFACPYSRLQ